MLGGLYPFGSGALGSSDPGTTLRLTAGTGTFTLTGVAAVLASTRHLAAAAGSYTLTGVAALRRITMYAATGVFTLTGLFSQVFRQPPRPDYTKWRYLAPKLRKLRLRNPKLED